MKAFKKTQKTQKIEDQLLKQEVRQMQSFN